MLGGIFDMQRCHALRYLMSSCEAIKVIKSVGTKHQAAVRHFQPFNMKNLVPTSEPLVTFFSA